MARAVTLTWGTRVQFQSGFMGLLFRLKVALTLYRSFSAFISRISGLSCSAASTLISRRHLLVVSIYMSMHVKPALPLHLISERASPHEEHTSISTFAATPNFLLTEVLISAVHHSAPQQSRHTLRRAQGAPTPPREHTKAHDTLHECKLYAPHTSATGMHLVAEGVGVQVVDVRHVDGVLEDAPVAALELDLPVHRLPRRVLQLRSKSEGF